MLHGERISPEVCSPAAGPRNEEGEWSSSEMNRIRTEIRRDLEGELQVKIQALPKRMYASYFLVYIRCLVHAMTFLGLP